MEIQGTLVNVFGSSPFICASEIELDGEAYIGKLNFTICR